MSQLVNCKLKSGLFWISLDILLTCRGLISFSTEKITIPTEVVNNQLVYLS